MTSIRRTCPGCHGKGRIDQPLCQLCQHEIAGDDPWWTSDSVVLPCGHLNDFYSEKTHECSECQGAGWVERPISSAEWASIRRRKVVRGFLLLLLGLIPFTLLALAVLNNRQGVCGSWWYGLLIVGLIVKLR